MQCVVFSKQEPLCTVWLASHNDRRVKRNQIFKTDIDKCCKIVLYTKTELALQVHGQLLIGLARVFSRKVRYCLSDINETLLKIKLATEAHLEDSQDSNVPNNRTQFDEEDFSTKTLNQRKTRDKGKIKICFEIANDNNNVNEGAIQRRNARISDITQSRQNIGASALRQLNVEHGPLLTEELFRDNPEIAEQSMALSNSMLRSILDSFVPDKSRSDIAMQSGYMDVTMQDDHRLMLSDEIDISLRTPLPVQESTIIDPSSTANIENSSLDNPMQKVLHDVVQKNAVTALQAYRSRITKRHEKLKVVIDNEIDATRSNQKANRRNTSDDCLSILMLPPSDMDGLKELTRRSKEYLMTPSGFHHCSSLLVKLLEHHQFNDLMRRAYENVQPSVHRPSMQGLKRSCDGCNENKETPNGETVKRRRSEQLRSNDHDVIDEQLTIDRKSGIAVNNMVDGGILSTILDANTDHFSAGLGRHHHSPMDIDTSLDLNLIEDQTDQMIRNPNKANLLSTIAYSTIHHETTSLHSLCGRHSNTNRRTVARSLALLLELRKANALDLFQKQSYAAVEITVGDSFNETLRQSFHDFSKFNS